MQTDELRAELRELANEEDEFRGDLPGVRRRVVRRRAAEVTIAVVAIVGIAVGALALTGSSKRAVTVAHAVKNVDLTAVPRADATVILPTGATVADAAGVASALDESDAVVRYASLPARNLAYVLSFAPNPEMKTIRTRVCADRSTRSFAVELSGTDDHAEQELTDAVGAGATVEPIGTRGAMDLEIFMDVHAGHAQIDAVRAQLASDPTVASYRFIDHQDAYNEFKVLFSDQPVLIENEKAADLPTSFRITVQDGTNPDDVATMVRGLPGVNQVITAGRLPLPSATLPFDTICASTSMIHIP